MINTGVLDYDIAPVKEDTGKRRRKEDKMERASDFYKSGT
jgi:hypothetical protein